jgi:hypothetical protein
MRQAYSLQPTCDSAQARWPRSATNPKLSSDQASSQRPVCPSVRHAPRTLAAPHACCETLYVIISHTGLAAEGVVLIGGSEVRGPRYTEQEARPEVQGPRTKSRVTRGERVWATSHRPPPKAKGPTGEAHIARCVGQGVTVHGPRHAQPQRAARTSHLGPWSACADTVGSREQMTMTCTPTTSPNEKAANRIWRPN